MQKIEGMLGLCCRAGQITLGADLALREIRAERAALALLDGAASEGTQKKIRDACAYRHVPLHMLPSGTLERACGRDGRMAAAVKPGKMAQQLLSLLNAPENPGVQNNETKNNAKCGGASIQ